MSSPTDRATLPPLIVGEVLFDCFAEGRRVLGGAPFNVAWNLRGLGLQPRFLSAVGDDADGETVRQRMRQWTMDLAGLQTAAAHPTGVVRIEQTNGQPKYTIDHPVAYDFIEPPPFSVSAADFSVMYMGSLVWRSETSRQTMRHLIRGSDVPRFVDINIREPWFDADWVPELFSGARWVKVSDEELQQLTDSRDVLRNEAEIVDGVRKLQQRYGGDEYFVTCGAYGAYWVQKNRVTFAPASEVENLQDTVGAGDAFVAATLVGLARHLSPSEMLNAAVRFAARVCGMRGATTDDHRIYEWPNLDQVGNQSTTTS